MNNEVSYQAKNSDSQPVPNERDPLLYEEPMNIPNALVESLLVTQRMPWEHVFEGLGCRESDNARSPFLGIRPVPHLEAVLARKSKGDGSPLSRAKFGDG